MMKFLLSLMVSINVALRVEKKKVDTNLFNVDFCVMTERIVENDKEERSMRRCDGFVRDVVKLMIVTRAVP